nr:tryptophan 7-halogenase [Pseudomonas sp. R5(2019)]
MSFAVQVLGRRRHTPLLEGASPRVVQGLERAGCHHALDVVGHPWQRVSAWGGERRAANGEHVIERSLFDSALIDDLEAAGIDFHDVTVTGTECKGEQVHIDACLPSRQARTFFADFIVDARGKSSPKMAPNPLAGPLSVALTRHYRGALPRHRQTWSESFEAGWAWATADRDGTCSVQCVVDPASLERGIGLDALHARFFRQLRVIPHALGQPVACGSTFARGAQAVLRGALVNERCLRVGDAAYSSDPLSGHGLYEAIAGAFAAAPVINTLLNDPVHGPLAMDYYQRRATLTFAQRARAGVDFYRSEGQWAEHDFWRLRREWSAWRPSLERGPKGLITTAPVVVDGFIRPRSVLVTDRHPLGVRFLAGVELAPLVACLCEGISPDALHTTPSRVRGDLDQIKQAISWLSSVPELSAPTFTSFVDRLRRLMAHDGTRP